MNDRKLEQLRMLMDWQLVELGFDPLEINRLCQEKDERDKDEWGAIISEYLHGIT